MLTSGRVVLIQGADYLFAQSMCLQSILGQRRPGIPGRYVIQKLSDDLRESAAVQYCLPILEPPHALRACMPMGSFNNVPHNPFVVWTHDLQYLLRGAAVAIHGSDELNVGSAEVHQDMVKLAFKNITLCPDITD